MGAALRHPSHDLHDAGDVGSDRRRGRRRYARKLCGDRGGEWRDRHDRWLHAYERALSRGRPRARRDVDCRAFHVHARAGAERCGSGGAGTDDRQLFVRSEEHTSELQSLMRISYAVFCLKKKKKEVTTITKTTSAINESK